MGRLRNYFALSSVTEMMRLNRESHHFGGGLVTNYVGNFKSIWHSYPSAVILNNNTIHSHEEDKCFNNA